MLEILHKIPPRHTNRRPQCKAFRQRLLEIPQIAAVLDQKPEEKQAVARRERAIDRRRTVSRRLPFSFRPTFHWGTAAARSACRRETTRGPEFPSEPLVPYPALRCRLVRRSCGSSCYATGRPLPGRFGPQPLAAEGQTGDEFLQAPVFVQERRRAVALRPGEALTAPFQEDLSPLVQRRLTDLIAAADGYVGVFAAQAFDDDSGLFFRRPETSRRRSTAGTTPPRIRHDLPRTIGPRFRLDYR